MLEQGKFFEKEVTFFTKYVPAARQLCKSKGLEKLIDIYPKCYFGDETTVVLDNLVLNKGFVLLPKENCQDLEAAKFALSTLAKHHAIAHAMILGAGGSQQFFKRFPNLDFENYYQSTTREFLEPVMENGLRVNIRILEKSGMDGLDKIIAMLKGLEGKVYQTLLDAMMITQRDAFFVLNHGDAWNNNMMFLKDPNSKIIDCVLIDFQETRYNTPGLELAYYLFTSVKPGVRREHFRELLQTYLETLNDTANSLGHPINMMIEPLELDFCLKFKFGFWFAFVLGNEVILVATKGCDLMDMGIAEWRTKTDELITKYLEEHPEKCEEGAKKIIELMKEFHEISDIVRR